MTKPFHDVVVFLPGILGSVLAKDGKDVWAPSLSAVGRGLFTLGGSVKSLTVENDDPAIDDLGDGVTATRLVPDIHLIPGLWKIDGYSGAIDFLKRACNLEPGNNFFEFPYDWRRDNRAAARRLARESRNWLRRWREQSGNTDAKLVLVGHSMGGLVSRYFVEVLEGWRDTRMLITLGTPHRGSLNALDFIANGLKKAIGPVTLIDLSEFVRSLSSVYQLLPVYACVEEGAGVFVRVSETTRIPNLDRSRAADAIGFHDDIQQAFEAHQDDTEYLRSFTLRPVVGTYQWTLQSAVLKGDALEVLPRHGDEDLGGDGTVPRVSAVPRTEGSQIAGISVAQRHGSLQNARTVLNQIEYLLSGLPIDDIKYRAVERDAHAGLALDDIYTSAEAVVLKVRTDDPSRELDVTVESVETSAAVITEHVTPRDDGWQEAQLQPLKAGTYRITIGGTGVATVEDFFVVLDP